MDWILQRAKAVMGLAVPGVATALMKAIEGGTGFDIPDSWELTVIMFLTGLIVHQVPNKP